MNTIFNKFISAMLCLAMLITTLPLQGCTSRSADASSQQLSVDGFKLNTYVQITAYGNGIDRETLDNALGLCDTYEKIFSRTLDESELARLNRHETTTVSHELGELINYGLEYSRLSQGAFDISIQPLSSLWDFTAEEPSVPDSELLSECLQYVDYGSVAISANEDGTYEVTLPEGMGLDLGAIAKGYIADKIKAYLTDHGVESALINLGGNVLCVGTKPDGSSFRIGVKKPFAQDGSTIAVAATNDASVVSSGTYERCFTSDGIFYHHILDPSTGYPYDNGLTQVTIFSSDSVTGDCLSTTCFALGLEAGLELINRTDGVEAVFVTEDGTMHMSDGCGKILL